MLDLGRNTVLLPPAPSQQFSVVTVLGPDGALVATIDPHTRVRTDVSGATSLLALPIWFADPKKFQYQAPLASQAKKAVPLAQVKKAKRLGGRDWLR